MIFMAYLQFRRKLVLEDQMFSMDINPDFGFGLDTTISFDTPEVPKEQVSLWGRGVYKGDGFPTVCDYRMVKYMKDSAKKS